MLLQILLFFFLLIIIFLVARQIVNANFFLIERFFKHRKLAIYILSFVYLPGTIIHELAHFIVATLLRVPTGPLSIFPQVVGDSPTKPGQSPTHIRIRTGHLMVARADLIRMTMIGIAPMIIGMAIIYFLGQTVLTSWGQSPFVSELGDSPHAGTVPLIAGEIYILYITSTTMFSSREDLKSLMITLPTAILIFTALYLTGINISVEDNLINNIQTILSGLNRGLITTAVIDYAVLLLLTIFRRFSIK